MKNILVPLIFKLLARLPLGAARALGWLIGQCAWRVKGRSYRITFMNTQACFPELTPQQRVDFVRESLIETAKTAAEAGAIWHNSWAWLQTKIVAVEGEALLHAELAQGKGLLVLAPHLGNWEVTAPYVANIAPLTAMYQPLALPALDRLILKGRSQNNIAMAPTNLKGVAMLLKALQKAKVVGILPDQVPEAGSGEVVDFFGQPAMTMSLVHSLIKRTGCRVVTVIAKRVPGGFKLITLPAAPEIYSENLLESLRGLNLSVETCVRLAPTQYQWEYNRFRSVPAYLHTSKNAPQ